MTPEMTPERWVLFGSTLFAALSCLVFLVAYIWKAAGFHDPIGRTLIAIKFGIFGTASLIAVNIVVNIDLVLFRIIFALLMVQLGCGVLWQVATIFRENGDRRLRSHERSDHL